MSDAESSYPRKSEPIYPTLWLVPFFGGFVVGLMIGGLLMALSFMWGRF